MGDPAAGVAAEWAALAERADASIFQTHAWHAAWASVFASLAKPRIALLRVSGELRAIAPLCLADGVLRFIGSQNHASDYCDFIVATGDPSEAKWVQALVDAIAERRPEWQKLELSNLPSHSPRARSLPTALRERGLRVCQFTLVEAPARRLGDEAADQAVLQKKSLKRKHAFFQKAGRLEFRHETDPTAIAEHLPAFFQQHVDRRALTDSPSLFAREEERRFYRELVQRLLPLGWLRFGIVSLDGKALAYHFGFEHRGRFVWYKPTFDVAHLKRSPGEVLLRYLLEDAISRKLREFDFTVGEESFKYRFANEIRTNDRLEAYTGWFAYVRRRLALAIKRRIRGLAKLRAPSPPPESE